MITIMDWKDVAEVFIQWYEGDLHQRIQLPHLFIVCGKKSHINTKNGTWKKITPHTYCVDKVIIDSLDINRRPGRRQEIKAWKWNSESRWQWGLQFNCVLIKRKKVIDKMYISSVWMWKFKRSEMGWMQIKHASKHSSLKQSHCSANIV